MNIFGSKSSHLKKMIKKAIFSKLQLYLMISSKSYYNGNFYIEKSSNIAKKKFFLERMKKNFPIIDEMRS